MSSIQGPLGAGASGATVELNRPLPAREAQTSSLAGQLGLGAVLLCGVLLSLAAVDTNQLLPETLRPDAIRAFQGAFAGLGFHLRSGELIAAFLVMFGGYVAVVREAERMSPRLVLWTIGVVVMVVALAPPLLSTDLFSYQEYARMFFGLHANPYTSDLQVLALDRIHDYVGAKWINTPTVYGPLFTLLSGLFQNTATTADIAVSAYAYKIIAALSCGAIVTMLWHGAKLRGANQVRAVALFGLNPLVILYSVGGGHNDLLMMAVATSGLWALLARRQGTGGALIIASAAVKLTGGLFLPFALAAEPGLGAGTRRRRVLLGAIAASVATLIIGFAVFGIDLSHMISTLSTVQGEGGWQSVPGFLFAALHWYSASHLVSMLFGIAFSLICARLLWRVWRGDLDWLDGAGWAAFFLLLATSSVLPWYITWLLVPAGLGTSRRLINTSIGFSTWVLLSTIIAYLPHPPVILGFHT